MSIAEKLTTIADNQQKIYEAGQNSMIDKSKIIELTETGTFINLREISEVPHKIKIVPTVDSATVKVIKGRNLFNEVEDVFKLKSHDDEWYLLDNYTSDNKYVETSYIPFRANCDLKAGHCYYFSAIFKPLKAGSAGTLGKSMYIAYHAIDGSTVLCEGHNGDTFDGAQNYFDYWGKTFSSLDDELVMGNMVIPEVDVDKFLIGYRLSGAQCLMKKGSLMIVETESDYKESRQSYNGVTYTIDSNGIEIESASPQMQFLSDGDIEVTYHKSYGMQVEYDRFWDGFTTNGKRTNYNYAFINYEQEYFKPKNVKPTSLAQGFSSNQFKIIRGIDTSKCTSLQQVFYEAFVKILGVIDTTSSSTLDRTFYEASGLTSIEKLILKDDGSQTFTTPFYKCSRLKNITIEGTIGNNITFAQSTKLTHDSLLSIINHLKDFGLVYYNDNATWTHRAFEDIVNGYSTTINATIEEGKEYTVRIKDNNYDAGENREFDFKCDVVNQIPMTYKDGYLEVTMTAEASLSGDFEVGVITDSADTENFGNIEIRQTPTTTKTLTLGTTLLAKLSDAEKAIATEKGWTLA